jgi:hypothetical protein
MTLNLNLPTSAATPCPLRGAEYAVSSSLLSMPRQGYVKGFSVFCQLVGILHPFPFVGRFYISMAPQYRIVIEGTRFLIVTICWQRHQQLISLVRANSFRSLGCVVTWYFDDDICMLELQSRSSPQRIAIPRPQPPVTNSERFSISNQQS